MNEPFAIPEEFWPLLNALYDGELNPETWATLESYLAENPGAQLAFVDYVGCARKSAGGPRARR